MLRTATSPAQKFIPADIEQWRALARKVGDFLHRKGEKFRRGEGAELLDAYEAVLARPEMRDTPPAQGVEAQEDTPNADDQRAKFEAWANTALLDMTVDCFSGMYRNPITRYCLEAWNAALAVQEGTGNG